MVDGQDQNTDFTGAGLDNAALGNLMAMMGGNVTKEQVAAAMADPNLAQAFGGGAEQAGGQDWDMYAAQTGMAASTGMAGGFDMSQLLPTAPAGGAKIFVGGLPKDCDENTLGSYFSQFGKIVHLEVKRDITTGMARGFGFVTFESDETLQSCLAMYDSHKIGSKWVEVKQATKGGGKGDKGKGKMGGGGWDDGWGMGKGKSAGWDKGGWSGGWGGGGGMMALGYDGGKGGKPRDNDPLKVFVGGLPKDSTDDLLLSYFSSFGTVTSAQVKTDPMTGQSRGFGFVSFGDEATAQAVLAMAGQHTINGKWIDVKSTTESPKGGGGKGGKDKGKGGWDGGWDGGGYGGGWDGGYGGGKGKGGKKGDKGGKGSNPPPTGPMSDTKIFVGGCGKADEGTLTAFFSSFGPVTEVQIKLDPMTQQPRGFAFISFESAEAAAAACANSAANYIDGKWVDVKPAQQSDKGGGKGKGFDKGGYGPMVAGGWEGAQFQPY